MTPRHVDSFLAEIAGWQNEGAIGGHQGSATSPRLLVVEDDPDLARFLAGSLCSDYAVDVAADGAEALSLLRREGPLTWSGTTRRPLTGQRAYPTTAGGGLPVWVAVGGTPASVIRAAEAGLPLMLAIIGGPPVRFRPFVELFRDATADHPLPVGVHSPGFIADTDAQARELLFPHFKVNRDRIGRERGWPPVSRAEFESEADAGALFVGSPETVARRIADTVTVLGLQRFDLKYANGPMPHEHLLRAIELYGTEVVPRVRALLEGGTG